MERWNRRAIGDRFCTRSDPLWILKNKENNLCRFFNWIRVDSLWYLQFTSRSKSICEFSDCIMAEHQMPIKLQFVYQLRHWVICAINTLSLKITIVHRIRLVMDDFHGCVRHEQHWQIDSFLFLMNDSAQLGPMRAKNRWIAEYRDYDQLFRQFDWQICAHK